MLKYLRLLLFPFALLYGVARELKIFKGNDGKTLFFEFCNKDQKNECVLEVLVFDLRGVVSILAKSPNMGTTSTIT